LWDHRRRHLMRCERLVLPLSDLARANRRRLGRRTISSSAGFWIMSWTSNSRWRYGWSAVPHQTIERRRFSVTTFTVSVVRESTHSARLPFDMDRQIATVPHRVSPTSPGPRRLRANPLVADHARCQLANAITPDPLQLVEPVCHCAVKDVFAKRKEPTDACHADASSSASGWSS
jgi:hypothetical protein